MLAFWLGGSGATIPGYRSMLAFWLGGGCAEIQPGYRSILAIWLGGASSGAEISPPEFGGGGGWGRISLPRHKIVRADILDEFNEEELSAILAAISWVIK
jgi:hypothetical protein